MGAAAFLRSVGRPIQPTTSWLGQATRRSLYFIIDFEGSAAGAVEARAMLFLSGETTSECQRDATTSNGALESVPHGTGKKSLGDAEKASFSNRCWTTVQYREARGCDRRFPAGDWTAKKFQGDTPGSVKGRCRRRTPRSTHSECPLLSLIPPAEQEGLVWLLHFRSRLPHHSVRAAAFVGSGRFGPQRVQR
jgi:hypothetical protein